MTWNSLLYYTSWGIIGKLIECIGSYYHSIGREKNTFYILYADIICGQLRGMSRFKKYGMKL